MRKYYLFWFFVFYIPTLSADEIPTNLLLVLNVGKTWSTQTIHPNNGEFQEIELADSLRTPAYDSVNNRVAYISDNGSVVEQIIGGSNNTLINASSNRNNYTQPAYSPSGEGLYIVELKEGTSVDTDILVFDKSRKELKPVVTQRSAQFDPMLPTENELYYSNVHCTVDCGKIIQEIWRKNLVSGVAEQVTLLNSISRQPFLLPDGEWLYFSSNKKGNYHIWRMNLKSKEYEQLTQGYVTDINPVLDEEENLYFIRRSPDGVMLMRRDRRGVLKEMILPDGVTDIRDLRISR